MQSRKSALIPVIILIIVPAIICACGGSHGKNGSAPSNQATWEEQLLCMGDLLYRTSNVNVINGLNLSEEQLRRLRAVAAEIEEEIPPFRLKGKLTPKLQEVADTYGELRDVLLRDEPISEDLKKKVIQARATEAEILKSGLTYDASRGYGQCLRCHRAPAEWKKKTVDINWAKKRNPSVIKQQGYAHIKAHIGDRGIALIWKKSAHIDELLTDNQKEMLKDFSCCLIPPQGLSNPVRIGQMDASVAEVRILEEVRKLPESTWKAYREKILKKLEYYQFIKSPDISDEAVRAFHKRAGSVLEHARSLSDEDFELQKEALVAEMKNLKPADLSEKIRTFQRAFFLVYPGSTEAYDAAIGRLQKGKK